MLMYERTSKDRKKESVYFEFLTSNAPVDKSFTEK